MAQSANLKTVHQAVREYVAAWASGGRPISTRDAVKAVKASVANIEHTNSELANIIASLAIQSGRNVHFNVEEPAG
jgi:hypothetical protein